MENSSMKNDQESSEEGRQEGCPEEEEVVTQRS